MTDDKPGTRAEGLPNAAASQERRQLAALARAVSGGDADQVLQAVRDAVGEWNQIWPDNWRLWQEALDIALPPGKRVHLHDLAGAPAPRFDYAEASPDMRAAWDLGHMPADQIRAAVGRLNDRDVAEIRDILGFQSPGHGIDFGPHAGLAYEACTQRLHGQGGEGRQGPPTPPVPPSRPAPGVAPEYGQRPAGASAGRARPTPAGPAGPQTATPATSRKAR